MKRVLLIVFLLFAIIGCAHRPLPNNYYSISSDQALTILRERSAAIHTISAQGLITLTRPSGDSIRLDAVLVARMPGELHLRAWKFNRTVFDLTLTTGGLWMLTADEPRLQQHIASATSGTVQFARAWSLLTHEFFFSNNLFIQIKGNDVLLTRKDESSHIVCIVDRRTLTPREYMLYDSTSHRRFVLRMEDYSLHDGIAYPERMIADSQFGQVDIQLRQIQINAPLAPDAFLHSPRAEKVQ